MRDCLHRHLRLVLGRASPLPPPTEARQHLDHILNEVVLPLLLVNDDNLPARRLQRRFDVPRAETGKPVPMLHDDRPDRPISQQTDQLRTLSIPSRARPFDVACSTSLANCRSRSSSGLRSILSHRPPHCAPRPTAPARRGSSRWASAARAQAESRPGTSDTPSCNLGPVVSPILLASCDRDGVYMVLKTTRSRQKQKLLPTLTDLHTRSASNLTRFARPRLGASSFLSGSSFPRPQAKAAAMSRSLVRVFALHLGPRRDRCSGPPGGC